MVPTPEQVLPLLAPLSASLPAALREGIDHADALQPDLAARDNYFWSHSARFFGRRYLCSQDQTEWKLKPDVPNTGIHLIIGPHTARVLRSLNGGAPHPGRNRARRDAWCQPSSQGQFVLTAGNELLVEPPEDVLRATSLLIDWHDIEDEPAMFVSLPVGPWEYGDPVRVHWRRPFPKSPGAGGYRDMAFPHDPSADDDDFGGLVYPHPTERDA